MAYDRRTPYAAKAIVAMRNNPDGTNPSATGGFFGFSGTVDLSSVLTSSAANLTVKIDDNTAETISVDFSAASSTSAVTVAEAVTALTTAAFTNITWSAGTDKNGDTRLKGVSSTGTFIQVLGDLAAALDFGQGVDFPNNGLEIYTFESKDGLVDCTFPPDTQDAQTNDVTGSLGDIRRMNIPAKLLGVSPVLSVYKDDWGLRSCIEGGTWDRTNDTYTPPLGDADMPNFMIIKYNCLYNKDNNNLADNDAVLQTTVHSCSGLAAEDTDTNSWKVKTYNITAVEYRDADDTRYPAWEEARISKATYEDLNISGLMES